MRNLESSAKNTGTISAKTKYRDYTEFLGSYSQNKREIDDQESVSSVDSGFSGKFGENKSCNTSNSSLNSEISVSRSETQKVPYSSYKEFLENYNNKKFGSVKPVVPEKKIGKVKSEIFIQVNQEEDKDVSKITPVENSVVCKVPITQKTIETNGIAKEQLNGSTKIETVDVNIPKPPKLPDFNTTTKKFQNNGIPPAPKLPSDFKNTPVMVETTKKPVPIEKNTKFIPPTPEFLEQLLKNRTPISESDFNTTTVIPTTDVDGKIDKTDPNVKKLVYNTYRGLLGAYNNRANEFVSTLPRRMVKKDQGVTKQLESIAQSYSGGNSSADLTGPVGFIPPVPPSFVGKLPSNRLQSEIPEIMDPPQCVQNAMMTKDKKPFTYTPGGIDLSEVRSPRMARRIERNANLGGVEGVPIQPQPTSHGPLPPSALAAMQPQIQVQVFPSGAPPVLPSHAPPPPPPPSSGPPPPPPPPTQPLPMQKCMTSDNQVVERPDMTKIIPENPMALLRKSPGPTRKSFVEQVDNFTPQEQAQSSFVQKLPSPPANTNRRSFVDEVDNFTQPVAQPNPQTRPWIQNTQQEQPTRPWMQNNVQQPPEQTRPWLQNNQQQAPEPQIKSSSVQLGSLYIPPVTNNEKTNAPTPPERHTPKTQSPSTPTLNKAPRPWQVQKPSQELPPWAIREKKSPETQSPPPVQQTYVTQARSPPVQQQPQVPINRNVQNRQQPIVPQNQNNQVNADGHVVWVTQPAVFQHPGDVPPQNFQQKPRVQQVQQQQVRPQPRNEQQQQIRPQPRNESAGTRIIPIQIEGVSNGAQTQARTPATPSNDKSFNRQQSWTNNPTQSNSFRVIQKITNTDGEENADEPITEHGPKTPRQFQQPPMDQIRKMKLTDNDRELVNRFKPGDEESSLHNEVDPRYRGAAIPSKAFKFLQSMTGPDDQTTTNTAVPRSAPVNRGPQVRTIPVQIEDNAPSQPYVHPSQQTVPEPKKYTGSSIPSRSFKMLQAMTAPEACADQNRANETENYSNDPSWEYHPSNFPPPYYWPEYYMPYYYPYPDHDVSKTDNIKKQPDTRRWSLPETVSMRATPVPFWYPPQQKKDKSPLKEETNGRTSRMGQPFDPRCTPVPYWNYSYPYQSSRDSPPLVPPPPPPPPPPMWDPYGYYYPYRYPPVYSPYPFFPQEEEINGYSSNDEMSKYNKPQQEPSLQTKEEVLIYPEEAVEEEFIVEENSNGLQTIKSVTNINVYAKPSIQPHIQELDSEESDDEECESTCVVEEEGEEEVEEEADTVPHELSTIYEESERSDLSRMERNTRESSILTTVSEDLGYNNENQKEESPLEMTLNSLYSKLLSINQNFENARAKEAENQAKAETVEELEKEDEEEEEEDDKDWWGIINEDTSSVKEYPTKKILNKINQQEEEKSDDEDLEEVDEEIKEEIEVIEEEIPEVEAAGAEDNVDFWETINSAPAEEITNEESDLDTCSTSSSDSSSSTSSESNKNQHSNVEIIVNNDTDEEVEKLDNSSNKTSRRNSRNLEEETECEIKISVKERISAFELTSRLQAEEKVKRRNKIIGNRNNRKSFEEFSEEEVDSGVTSDVSRHISEADNEEFPELRKMSKYQRAATHSRLFKLLQDECDNEEDDEEPKIIEENIYTVTIKTEKKSTDRDQLSLPLRKNMSDQESFSSSGINSPGSGEYINERLVNELVQSMLRKKKGQMFKSVPLEKLHAAAIRILQEDLDGFETSSEDCSSFLSPLKTGTQSSTPAQTPQEFYSNYSEYKQYYDSWSEAEKIYDANYDILPSKAFKLIQEHSYKNKVSGILAKCPRVLSAKNIQGVLESRGSPSSPENVPEIQKEATGAS